MKRGGFEEVTKHGGVFGVVGQVVGDPVVEFESVFATDVCKFGVFERTPEVFDGVEFRGVGREVLDREAGMLDEQIAEDLGPMMAPAIPDHDHLAAKVNENSVVSCRTRIGSVKAAKRSRVA